MKLLFRSLAFIALGLTTIVGAAAAENASASPASAIAAVTAADNERTAAMIAGDATRLDAIFSDELRYAHSSGKVDRKASLTQSLVSHQTVYRKFDYKERTFTLASPSVALMSGRCMVSVTSGGQDQLIDLNYIAVWREEKGQWRFLAWQSCRNPAPAPTAAAAKP